MTRHADERKVTLILIGFRFLVVENKVLTSTIGKEFVHESKLEEKGFYATTLTWMGTTATDIGTIENILFHFRSFDAKPRGNDVEEMPMTFIEA